MSELSAAFGLPDLKGRDTFTVKYPTRRLREEYVDAAGRKQRFTFIDLERAALFQCQMHKCDMRTFIFCGEIDAGPLPGCAEGERAFMWQAQEKI
jgi:hypothetical protein